MAISVPQKDLKSVQALLALTGHGDAPRTYAPLTMLDPVAGAFGPSDDEMREKDVNTQLQKYLATKDPQTQASASYDTVLKTLKQDAEPAARALYDRHRTTGIAGEDLMKLQGFMYAEGHNIDVTGVTDEKFNKRFWEIARGDHYLTVADARAADAENVRRQEVAAAPAAAPAKPAYAFNANVQRTQAYLLALGYENVGPVDGLKGPKTNAALAAFVKDFGLEQSDLNGVYSAIAERVESNADTMAFVNKIMNDPALSDSKDHMLAVQHVLRANGQTIDPTGTLDIATIEAHKNYIAAVGPLETLPAVTAPAPVVAAAATTTPAQDQSATWVDANRANGATAPVDVSGRTDGIPIGVPMPSAQPTFTAAAQGYGRDPGPHTGLDQQIGYQQPGGFQPRGVAPPSAYYPPPESSGYAMNPYGRGPQGWSVSQSGLRSTFNYESGGRLSLGDTNPQLVGTALAVKNFGPAGAAYAVLPSLLNGLTFGR